MVRADNPKPNAHNKRGQVKHTLPFIVGCAIPYLVGVVLDLNFTK